MAKGNIGNWSEILALLDVLITGGVEGTSPAVGQPDIYFYKVDNATRMVGSDRVTVTHTDSGSIRNSVTGDEMPESDLIPIHAAVRDAMIDRREHGKQGTDDLQIPEAQPFMDFLGLQAVGVKSTQKADIELGIVDPLSGDVLNSAFSIKSFAGVGAPSLLNASGPTSFVYRVEGLHSTTIDDLNSVESHKQRLQQVQGLGGRFVFETVSDPVFESNLRTVDWMLPEILGAALLRFRLENGMNRFEKLSKALPQDLENVLGRQISSAQLRYKFASLLEASALGITPQTPWDGRYEVSGGILRVEKDFRTRLTRIGTRDEFREALMRNTKLDTGKHDKHDYEYFYPDQGLVKIRLNLQIRYDMTDK